MDNTVVRVNLPQSTVHVNIVTKETVFPIGFLASYSKNNHTSFYTEREKKTILKVPKITETLNADMKW